MKSFYNFNSDNHDTFNSWINKNYQYLFLETWSRQTYLWMKREKSKFLTLAWPDLQISQWQGKFLILFPVQWHSVNTTSLSLCKISGTWCKYWKVFTVIPLPLSHYERRLCNLHSILFLLSPFLVCICGALMTV